jgi:uncharacterized protein CbrC (UPF0167 family)
LLLRSLNVTEPLPEFPYHPDPLATGSVVVSDAVCACCGRERGYVYTGPVYAAGEPGRPCPWCIADGSAAHRFEAHFSADVADDEIGSQVLVAIAERTPGFTAWQDAQWLAHCGDGAAFLGRAGARELAGWPDAVESLRQDIRAWGWPDHQIDDFLDSLDSNGQATAYLFRCRTCATHLAYADFT